MQDDGERVDFLTAHQKRGIFTRYFREGTTRFVFTRSRAPRGNDSVGEQDEKKVTVSVGVEAPLFLLLFPYIWLKGRYVGISEKALWRFQTRT